MSLMIGLAARARSGKDTVAGMLLGQSPLLAAYALADPVKMACEVIFGLTQAEAWTDDSLKEKKICLWDRSPRECFQLLGTDWMRARDPEHWLRRAQHLLRYGPNPAPVAGTIWERALDPLYGMNTACLHTPESANRTDPFWGLSPLQAADHLRAHVLASYPDFEQRRAQRPLAPPTHRLPDMSQARCLLIKDIRYENEADFIRRHGGEIWHIERPGNPVISQHSSEWGIARQPQDRLILNDQGLAELADKVAAQWRAFEQAHALP